MPSLKQYRTRIASVKSTQKITSAMKMVAAAKLRRAQEKAEAARPYAERMSRMLGSLAGSLSGGAGAPALLAGTGRSEVHLVVVATSDRGLCGAFNGHVTRTATRLMKPLRESGHELVLAVQGKKGMGFCKFQKIPVAMPLNLGDKVKFEDVDALATRLMEEFVAGKYDSVQVVYMRFVSAAKQEPEVMQLLPLKAVTPAAGSAGGSCEFLPSADRILSELLPRSVKVSLYQAFLDAAVSEQAMRRVAMKAATDNARGLGRVLKRNYNRARQAKITTELTEIVSGAAALE